MSLIMTSINDLTESILSMICYWLFIFFNEAELVFKSYIHQTKRLIKHKNYLTIKTISLETFIILYQIFSYLLY